ncbi:hypothetical protein PV10_02601 [Exophiala mesophila]|uniref:Amidohydrolase-related domain-containing protein n=1 Tax=Exophiala mesophila TaxID=212818 RepID=A0A0D1WZC7_EXOME|nr:uncharacterized protein PV10_02601 [Exophiala mesophila]KIV94880.1 hypothetical protein PV10_02601 [Exophiala mesophila]
MQLENVILPDRDPKTRWDIEYTSNTITSIRPSTSSTKPSSLLVAPLCHPHVHLDKPYLLTCNSSHHPSSSSSSADHPNYDDLTPQTGSFSEALSFTGQAKGRYTPEDLYLRGSQLLATSLAQGVTAVRAFVEVDHVTQLQCLTTAIALKAAFSKHVHVQICIFAQDPIFSTDHGDANRQILVDALDQFSGDIHVLGTTPYVETDDAAQVKNIQFAVQTALQYGLHLDFHLDYNLDRSKPARVWDVIRCLKEMDWVGRAQKGKTVVLGHCSRLLLFDNEGWKRLAKEIHTAKLPVFFVGLPTSDVFMMGRPSGDDGQEALAADRQRGTLQIPSMIRDYGLNACLGVNNVGNAFTPWGSGDPIALASLGVGIYQAGTAEDARLLWQCVTSRARQAIGLEIADRTASESNDADEIMLEARKGELLVIENEEWIRLPGDMDVKVPSRQRVSIKDVVWDPPDVRLRKIMR